MPTCSTIDKGAGLLKWGEWYAPAFGYSLPPRCNAGKSDCRRQQRGVAAGMRKSFVATCVILFSVLRNRHYAVLPESLTQKGVAIGLAS